MSNIIFSVITMGIMTTVLGLGLHSNGFSDSKKAISLHTYKENEMKVNDSSIVRIKANGKEERYIFGRRVRLDINSEGEKLFLVGDRITKSEKEKIETINMQLHRVKGATVIISIN